MNLIVNTTASLTGVATIPGSKSHSIRAIILASLCNGKSVIRNILHSDDTRDAMQACQQLGAKISEQEDTLVIESSGLPLKPISNKISTGNSGITTHFLMPVMGLRENADEPIILDCSDQMRMRPIKTLADALVNLGLHIEHLGNESTLPLSISGKLHGGKTYVGGVCSQYLSALLIALPHAEIDSEVKIIDLKERPYVEMTLSYLQEQNIQYTHTFAENVDSYQVKANNPSYQPIHLSIPGDFSSASCVLAASVLIPSKIILEGLNMSDQQGDKELVYILQKMGADIVIEPTRLIVQGGKELTGIEIDLSEIPDLLPALSILGVCASGKTIIHHTSHAKIKETDRVHSMTEGLQRMGAKVEMEGDTLTLHRSKLRGTHINGYGDHRTVMAFSVAGMLADGKTIISDAQAIHKTFPEFVQTLKSLGAKMELDNESLG